VKKMYLVVESVEVIRRVQIGLEPHIVRLPNLLALEICSGFCEEAGHGTCHKHRVVLPVPRGGHVPGQLVPPLLNTLEVLHLPHAFLNVLLPVPNLM
jgi:hypothetical protein